jgi:hypothetical protein
MTKAPRRAAPSTHRLPPALCPHCGFRLDAASNMEGEARPKPGDLCLCMNCGAPSLFTEPMGLRRLTQAEVDAMPDNVKRATISAQLHCLARGALPEKAGHA